MQLWPLIKITKEIEQNLPQGLSTLTRGIQIPRAAFFKTKKIQKKFYKSDFMQLFSADVTIFKKKKKKNCPWKHKKTYDPNLNL